MRMPAAAPAPTAPGTGRVTPGSQPPPYPPAGAVLCQETGPVNTASLCPKSGLTSTWISCTAAGTAQAALMR